jgi:predicted Rossmann fold flavoprotein
MKQDSGRLIVIGGGAAGFFGAIAAGETGIRDATILEAGPEVLTKVRISGGGRCNLTHHCFDPRELADSYPRGKRSLLGPFHRWQPADTVDWFEKRGVALKTEEDGRMFPATDDSRTVVDCLTRAARDSGVAWRTRCGVSSVRAAPGGGFLVETTSGEQLRAQWVLIATGGIRSGQARKPAEAAGHPLADPVPSLFTFRIDDPRLAGLQGVSVPEAILRAERLETSGPLLVTHWGLSGPAVLKLSAWGARTLAGRGYRFDLRIDWTGGVPPDELRGTFETQRRAHGTRKVVRHSAAEGVTRRLWQRLCATAGIGETLTWAELSKTQTRKLTEELTGGRYAVLGKSPNKDEFVTCGGVRLNDVNLKTMESKLVPGLFFAGEVLDIDGLTGGFNFQAAWTTGRIAGEAVARLAQTHT